MFCNKCLFTKANIAKYSPTIILCRLGFLNLHFKLSGVDTVSREVILSKVLLLPSEKGSTLKGKNLLPPGNKFFPFRVDPFSEEVWHIVQKVRNYSYLLYKLWKICRVYIIPFSMIEHIFLAIYEEFTASICNAKYFETAQRLSFK